MTSKIFQSILFISFFYFTACTGPALSDAAELVQEAVSAQTEQELIDSNGPVELTVDTLVSNEPDTNTNVLGSNEQYDDIDWKEYEASMTKDYSFVIVISTTDYDEALERAIDASEKLGYKLDLRGLVPNEKMGLTLPKDVCEGICGGDIVDYPQYLPRDSWGDTKYVSVEYSNGFDGYNPGYYIVIVASGEKGDPVVQEALKEAQAVYNDAYAKTCQVWMGCGC
jgi:hypothetical protein